MPRSHQPGPQDRRPSSGRRSSTSAAARLIAVLVAAAAILAPDGSPVGPRAAHAADPDPLEPYFGAIAATTGGHVERTGVPVTLTDATGDVDGGSDRGAVDIVEAGYAWLPEAPPPGMLNTLMPPDATYRQGISQQG